MRPVIVLIMGFIILIGGSLYLTSRINTTAEGIQIHLIEAESDIYNDKWDNAIIEINKSYEEWSKTKNKWAMVLNHSTLSTIEVSFLRLQQFTINKESALSLAELKTLLLLIKDVPESENLRLNNIF